MPTLPTPSSGAATSPPETDRRGPLRLFLLRRKRLLIALGVLTFALILVRGIGEGASGGSPERSLALALGGEGLRVEEDSVVWLEEDNGPLHRRPCLFLARIDEAAAADVYYAEARPGGSGSLLSVSWVSNLTETASTEEEQLTRVGEHVAYASRTRDHYDAVVLLAPGGEDETQMAGWPARARLQHRITNLQRSGRARGFGRRRYSLAEPATSLQLRAREGHLLLDLPEEAEVEIDPEEEEAVAGAEHVRTGEEHQGMPGGIAWVVDTVRNVPWIGREPIEWLESKVFGAQDVANRARYAVLGGEQEETEAEVADDLGTPRASRERIAMLTVTDAELGWPPAVLEPILDDHPVAGEGEWIPIVDDPYVNSFPGAPPAFYQSFIRSDPERRFSRVYVTIWDPRQVQLHVMPGTTEPETETGERGAGTIPQDEETLDHLVAAFNGGFQALHGEFGFMSEGRLYLPPKPWAATVAVFDDGRVGMGSWPAPSWEGRRYDEEAAVAQIPEDMVEMRQNLTNVVEDDQFNPWRRWWWGAAPASASEQTFTYRTGLCVTDEGFLAFFWGRFLDADSLGRAMIAARCRRGMHLDMNSPHTGLEFYNPYREGAEVPELPSRPRRDAEFDGPLPRGRGWRLRARRAVRSMRMPFPRYVNRDERDFFYLTLRPTLPGPALTVEGAEVTFSTDGLPHAGWPHALARASLGEGEGRTWLVRIDPRRGLPGPVADAARLPAERRSLAWLAGGARLRVPGPVSLFARRARFGHRYQIGSPGEEDTLILSGPLLGESDPAAAAIGVDAHGFLVYAERGSDPRPLGQILRAAGVEQAIALPEGARLAFEVRGRFSAPDGMTPRDIDRRASLPFFAEERPAASVIFPDTQPIPYSAWGFIQGRRVRYFPEGTPRFQRPPAAE